MTGFAENIRRKEGHIVAKRKVKILGRIDDKDVELCRTTNPRVGNHAMQTLVDARIPFTQHWIRVPFYKRERYHGAREICVTAPTGTSTAEREEYWIQWRYSTENGYCSMWCRDGNRRCFLRNSRNYDRVKSIQ